MSYQKSLILSFSENRKFAFGSFFHTPSPNTYTQKNLTTGPDPDVQRFVSKRKRKVKLHTDIRELTFKNNHMLILLKKHGHQKGQNGFEGKAGILESKFTGCPSGSASSCPCVTPVSCTQSCPEKTKSNQPL